MAETIFEALRASAIAAPSNPFICVPEGTSYAPEGFEWTYTDVLQRVLKLSNRYERAGYGQGHRVALLLGSRVEFFIHLSALNAIGASIVPLNPDHRHAELRYQFAHGGAELAVSLAHHVNRLREVSRELEHPLS